MADDGREIRSLIPSGNRAMGGRSTAPAMNRREAEIPSRMDAGTGSTGTTAADRCREGQSLVAIADMTSDLIALLSSRFDAQNARISQMESKLIGRMDALETGLIGKLQSSAGRILRGKGAEGSRCSGRKLSRGIAPHAVLLEDCLKEEEQHVVVPLATWTMIVAAVSFAQKTEKAKDWMDKDTHDGMSDDLAFIGSQSGLSALLFSVNGQKRETKEKFRRPEGRLWSYMIRNAVASLFNYSASHLFVTISPRTNSRVCKQPGRTGPMAPIWLLELYPRDKGMVLVNQVIARLEKTEGLLQTARSTHSAGAAVSKKRRLNAEDCSATHAVKHTRKVMVDKLNYGRCNGREYLYNNLLFVVDRICHDYDSFSDARADGYAIDFVGFGFNSKGCLEEDPRDIWDVRDANTDTLKKARLHSRPPEYTASDDENVAAVEALITDHPWLSVKLTYKMKVRRPGSASALSRSGDADRELFFTMEEWLPLHSLALGFYMEMFKKEDPKFLLSCSQFSIKALHVLAIALRGALRQVMGLDTSDVELAALGNVDVFSEENGGDDEYGDGEGNEDRRAEREGKGCLSIIRKTSKRGEDRTGYEKLRDSLFIMPWMKYVEAQRARDEAERRRNESSMSENAAVLTADETEIFDPAAL